ncbi:MAG TPA: nicotinate (nicotinamide) nucleotide adenylyltransferase [Acholeplasmataceae bacterium]|jgi:nicotinate-nucleotide adenylyltransferase|nr:nicotinate (nicotinamide) nucleotide adenylyltransferase [Acholeplasmataceae bacterium]
MQILFGGAFNPPTIAHYEIIKYLLEKFEDAQIILLPTNQYYHKNDLAPFQDRFNMLDILCQKLNSKRVTISDYEAKLDKYYGTYYILKAFNHPYFVIGADSLKNIDKWIKYPDIVIENKFIVFPRDNINIKGIMENNPILKKYNNNFIILENFRKLNISSTMFRKDKENKYLLEEVAQYIKENNLYEVK